MGCVCGIDCGLAALVCIGPPKHGVSFLYLLSSLDFCFSKSLSDEWEFRKMETRFFLLEAWKWRSLRRYLIMT